MLSLPLSVSLFTVLPCEIWIKQHCTGLWETRGQSTRWKLLLKQNCIFRMNAYHEFLLFRTLKEWCLLGTFCGWTRYPWSCSLMLWTIGAKDNSKPFSFDMRYVRVCIIHPKLKQYLNKSLITILFLFFRDILVRLVHFWN